MVDFNPDDLPNVFVKTNRGDLRGFKVIEAQQSATVYYDDKTGKYYTHPEGHPEQKECDDNGKLTSQEGKK